MYNIYIYCIICIVCCMHITCIFCVHIQCASPGPSNQQRLHVNKAILRQDSACVPGESSENVVDH